METLHLILLIAHVLVACLIIGMAFFACTAIFKKQISDKDLFIFRTVTRFGFILAPTQLLLGVGLIATEPKLGRNPLVWAKIILFIIESITIALVTERRVKMIETGQAKPSDEQVFKFSVLAALVLVTTIAILGVIVVGSS